MPKAAARTTLSAFVLATAGLLVSRESPAHPGSGVFVDDQGRVFFVHAEVGVWTVNSQGELSRRDAPGYHFMIADPNARFAGQPWPRFPDGEIHVVGADPALLLATSFPVTIAPDGALYYPEANEDGHVHIMRAAPSGHPTDFATLPISMEINYEGERVPARWIHGLASDNNGVLYYCERNAVRRIATDGSSSLVAGNIAIPGCAPPPAFPSDNVRPYLRGLDIADDGTIYAAASGCSALIKITPNGAVSVALRSEQPWSPTGVAVAGSDIYVLEYNYIAVDRAGDWLPRIRKLSPGGRTTVIATVDTRPD